MALDPITIIEEYAALPSVSTDPQYKDGVDAAREYIVGKLEDLGFSTQISEAEVHPVVFAERGGDPAWPHLVIYSHYDVQPPDPLELWETPAFRPTVKDDRIFGRGTADNKGPTAVQLAALAAVLEENPDLPLRLTWVIEGEEEMGSPSFPAFLEAYKDKLASADFVVLSDTACPNPEQMAITTGLRGLMAMEVTLYGPRGDLHSGVHGGALMNPIQALAEVLASLHNADATINVDGFYDNVIAAQDWERGELAKLPGDLEEYRQYLDIPQFTTAHGYNAFEAVRFAPTLEFNGIGGGYQGAGDKTVIPAKAFAKITCRLVPNQDPGRIRDLVSQAIQDRCPPGCRVEIRDGHGGSPYRVVPPRFAEPPPSQNEKFNRAFDIAHAAIADIWGREPIYLREGGSVPIIEQLQTVAGLDSLMLGLFTPADNLHAPNESMHLGIIKRGQKLYERLFRKLAEK